MRKIILMMQVSLDGYFEGPNRELDWHMVNDELHRHFNELLGGMGGFLDGRVTYELMAEFWPAADQDPSSTAPMVEFARIWRDMPKLVYSRTLDHAAWNTTVVRDVVPEDVRELKAQPAVWQELGWKTSCGCPSCRPALNYYLLCAWPGEYRDDAQSRFVNERVHANIQKDGTFSVVPRMWGGLTNA